MYAAPNLSLIVGERLEYRQQRWPHTANPHLLVSKESALHHGPVSSAYLTSLRGLTAPAHQGATPGSPAAGLTRGDRRAAPASWR